jgi:diguanylate cyclase (GGDEF)-like protein
VTRCPQFAVTETRRGAAEVLPREDVASLLDRTDQALFASKFSGRNCGHLHDGDAIIPISSTKKPASRATRPADGSKVRVLDRLPNEKSLAAELDRRVAESHQYHLRLSIICVKVADLKGIVSEHGDNLASRVLETVAQRLQQTARDGDFLATDGEDGFALLLPRSSEAEALQIARRIELTQGKQEIRAGDRCVAFRLVVGQATCQGSDDVETLRRRARQTESFALAEREQACVV